MVNDVTLFSNGIGHFRRMYKVGKEPKVISIPFKTDCIGDVAASLQVFGKVRLNSPPSFTPANFNATSLKIEPNNALRSLLQQLSGSTVKVSKKVGDVEPHDFVLLGIDAEQYRYDNGDCADDFSVVLLSSAGVTRIRLEEIANVAFCDPSVQTEISKALKLNFQSIKPDSTILDLSLSSTADAEAEAMVQYTIPVAAWKMRYAIRQTDTAFVLDGAAVIDNNTDEDWDNFRISVVTGNPISFATDIAHVVMPKRNFVHLVEAETLGNVRVEEGYPGAAPAACLMAGSVARSVKKSLHTSKMSLSNKASFGLESVDAADLYDDGEVAQTPGVEAKDVGDFCVFTSKEPITILARKSAVVPMFAVDLQHAGVVLLYKERNHAQRPFRAVKFKNETTYSLGQGKTVIYNDGIFSGECVLESTKPNENRMLPHCLENSVKVVKTSKDIQTRHASINISKGVVVDEQVSTAVTEYVISNKKPEVFKMALEHDFRLSDSDIQVEIKGIEVKEQEKLTHGVRLYFELAADQTVTLAVTEVAAKRHRIVLHEFDQLRRTLVQAEPIWKDTQIKMCADLQVQIDQIQDNIQSAMLRRTELEQQATRVQKSLEAVKGTSGSSGKVTEWVNDLDMTEQEIRKINKEMIPGLQTMVKKFTEQLREELKKILITWSEAKNE